MKITKVIKRDFSDWVELGIEFWSKHSAESIKKDFRRMLDSNKEQSFLCRNEKGVAIGFIDISIRTDYVEGSKTNPVGYLEGIYVKKQYRKQGIATLLLKEAEKWLKNKKVFEIGSDAEIHNKISHKFHKKLGFKQGETIIHYLKKI